MATLRDLYEQDIQDSKRKHWYEASVEQYKWIRRRDFQRLREVISLYKAGRIRTASDYHCAALIMQHGERPSHYRLAHRFAGRAVKLGDHSARCLYAATLDRWLLSAGRSQKFGTQFRRDEHLGWVLAGPVDPVTTDAERARYRVPPLADSVRTFGRDRGLVK